MIYLPALQSFSNLTPLKTTSRHVERTIGVKAR
jgi:hypothetical protein